MVGEIDRDCYCTAGFFDNGICRNGASFLYPCTDKRKNCGQFCRKWPTLEQFGEEWGTDYPDDGAVYILVDGIWLVRSYIRAREIVSESPRPVVCACSPFGSPPEDWRPK